MRCSPSQRSEVGFPTRLARCFCCLLLDASSCTLEADHGLCCYAKTSRELNIVGKCPIQRAADCVMVHQTPISWKATDHC
jgi:hypothetical protein